MDTFGCAGVTFVFECGCGGEDGAGGGDDDDDAAAAAVAFAALASRALSSHACRVLWSTGHLSAVTSAEDMVCLVVFGGGLVVDKLCFA